MSAGGGGAAKREARVSEPGASSGPDISVIVVVTRDPRDLDGLYRRFRAVLDGLDETTCEFVFVGEPWARYALEPVRALAASGHPIRVLEVGTGAGESNLLLAGRDNSHGRLLVTLPTYQRIEPADITRLIDRVRNGVDLASAARIQNRDHWFNRLVHWSFHRLLRLFVGRGFRDIASGVRVLRPQVLDEVRLYGDGFRFLPLLAEREGFRVEEVAVRQGEPDQSAKLYSPGTYLRRLIDLVGLAFVTRFTDKPLRFFGLVGGVLVLVGGSALVVLTVQRIAGTPLSDRPALVAAVLFTVLGVQSIALGLIGEIIVHFSVGNRRGYRIERPPEGPGARASAQGDSGADDGTEAVPTDEIARRGA